MLSRVAVGIVYCIIIIVIVTIFFVYQDFKCNWENKNEGEILNIENIQFRTGDLLFYRSQCGIANRKFDKFAKSDREFSRKFHKTKLKTKFTLNNLKESVKNGFFEWYSGTNYTHVGLVVVIKGTPYLYEITEIGERLKPYIRFSWFDFRNQDKSPPIVIDVNYLKKYQGNIHLYKYIGDDISEKKILNLFESNQNLIYNFSSFFKYTILGIKPTNEIV